MKAARGLAGASLLAVVPPLAAGARSSKTHRSMTERWSRAPVEPRRGTRLGISFRPLQAVELGLEPKEALEDLLQYPFDVVRLASYWDRMEKENGQFDPSFLDWQVEAAERAGKSIIICTGAVKSFGYPEFFAPAHRVERTLREGSLVTPSSHPELSSGALWFVRKVVERYRDCPAVVAWQVEHEAVDPLGLEHSWRLSANFVAAEVDAARKADPHRPIIMNGFPPTSWPVAASQRWSTPDRAVLWWRLPPWPTPWASIFTLVTRFLAHWVGRFISMAASCPGTRVGGGGCACGPVFALNRVSGPS